MALDKKQQADYDDMSLTELKRPNKRSSIHGTWLPWPTLRKESL